MRLRSSLGRWVAHADALHDHAKRRWRRLSPFDGRWMIVPYRGFGTAQQIEVGGRVLGRIDFSAPSSETAGWRNVVEFARRMASHELPGATLRLRCGDVTAEVTADVEGHFVCRLAPSTPPPPGWQPVQVELVDPAPRAGRSVAAVAQSLVPSPQARFGVISDIDDTVIWSDVRRKLRMLALIARGNAHTRKPLPGVAAFYRALQAGASGREDNPFFYVSSSPWNLYTPLVDFMSLQGLPAGPLMLKDFGDHLLFGGAGHGEHKLGCIERVLRTYPALPFVLSGDSGEQDPEIYAEVARRFPGRVRAVYIRAMHRGDAARTDAIDALRRELGAAGVPLHLGEDAQEAAAHAAAIGLLAPAAEPAVQEDTQADRHADATAPR